VGHLFPPDFPRLFIVSGETSVPQVRVRRPFRELDLGDKLRLQPTAFFHFTRGQRPHRAPLLRQIGERTLVRFKGAQTFENFAANVRHKSIADFGDKIQDLAVVASHDKRVEDKDCPRYNHR